MRATDTAGLLGGDEFAILMPETEGEPGQLLMERIQKRLLEIAHGRDWAVGFSAGIAVFPRPPANCEEALHFADELMYAVKRSGKGRVMAATHNPSS